MPRSHCQEQLVGLLNKPISIPCQWASVKASGRLPKPSPNNASNPEDPSILTPFHLHHYHLTTAIRTRPHVQQETRILLNDGKFPGMTWGHLPGMRLSITKRLRPRPEAMRPMDCPTHITFTLARSWVWEDQSSVSTSSSVSSRSNRSGGSRHSHHIQWHHRESGGHMKINLPIIKDEDMTEAITYQSWCWDLMVYCCAGCRDCTLLPYAICSLQGCLGELVRSSGTDITLGDIHTLLNEPYNNAKALDALNQKLFQLCMGKKETVSD